MSQPESIANRIEREVATIQNTLGFFASVIKSGEPWTAQCQEEYEAALAVLARNRSNLRLADELTERFLPIFEAARPLINNGETLREYARRTK